MSGQIASASRREPTRDTPAAFASRETAMVPPICRSLGVMPTGRPRSSGLRCCSTLAK